MSDKLQPCPMCNRAAIFEYGDALVTGNRIVKVRCYIGCVAQIVFYCTEQDAAIAWNSRALSSSQQEKTLQSLADQAQELDMGYGQNACPSCGKSNPAEIHTCSPQVQPSCVAMTDETIKSIANANGHPVEGFYVAFLERDLIWFARRLLLKASPKEASTGTEPSELLDLAWWHGAQACNLPAGAPLPKKMHARTAEILREFHRASLSSPQEASKPQDERNPYIGSSFDDFMASQPSAASGREAELRMLQAYPTLAEFFGKHGIGSITNTSCFKCGKIGERAITHLELPNIYICKDCAALTGAAPADANVGIPEALQKAIRAAIALLWEIPANAPNTLGLRAYDIAGELKTLLVNANKPTPTEPEPSGPADKVDAENYRYLRTKVCIIGLESGAYFDFINLPRPTYVAPDAAVELDAAIDRMRSEDGKGGKL